MFCTMCNVVLNKYNTCFISIKQTTGLYINKPFCNNCREYISNIKIMDTINKKIKEKINECNTLINQFNMMNNGVLNEQGNSIINEYNNFIEQFNSIIDSYNKINN